MQSWGLGPQARHHPSLGSGGLACPSLQGWVSVTSLPCQRLMAQLGVKQRNILAALQLPPEPLQGWEGPEPEWGQPCGWRGPELRHAHDSGTAFDSWPSWWGGGRCCQEGAGLHSRWVLPEGCLGRHKASAHPGPGQLSAAGPGDAASQVMVVQATVRRAPLGRQLELAELMHFHFWRAGVSIFHTWEVQPWLGLLRNI